jgi:hypothetical protein
VLRLGVAARSLLPIHNAIPGGKTSSLDSGGRTVPSSGVVHKIVEGYLAVIDMTDSGERRRLGIVFEC